MVNEAEALLAEHLQVIDTIKHVLINFKKLSKPNITFPKVRSRLSTLGNLWAACQALNVKLWLIIPQEKQRTLSLSNRTDRSIACESHNRLSQLPRITLPKFSGKLTEWEMPHLQGLHYADPAPSSRHQIHLLIGADLSFLRCIKWHLLYGSLLLRGVRKGPQGTPTTQLTVLGWVISGPTGSGSVESEHTASCNHVSDHDTNSLFRKFKMQKTYIYSCYFLTMFGILLSLKLKVTNTIEIKEKTLNSTSILSKYYKVCISHLIFREKMAMILWDSYPYMFCVKKIKQKFILMTIKMHYLAIIGEIMAYGHLFRMAHTDLPSCPTREKPPGKRDERLLATLCDKQRYVIHYRNLQQCTRHGLRIAKVHRILQFTQSPWLRDYIELNTKFRTLTKNDFEKNLYKLMNNAVFGKTMENVRDRVDVKLEGRYGAEAMIAKPNFHSRSVFSENLVAIELRKLEMKFDKPIYVDMCILDISKTCLYEFHHEYMAPLFHDKCKIMYTDTDSLIYHVECDDVYEIIKRDIDRFDTSYYSVDNPYRIPLANKKVPGLMKDKNNGAIMTEFVGLRAKMYALRVQGKKDTKKAKRVKSNVVARSITFDDYTRCLNDAIEMTRSQSCIRSKLHEVYTISEIKIALSPHDDKRYIVSGSTDTLPWGHYRCK
ncbi:hypothetical protein ALC62_07766 [Cyphomyrmex costatus]|uniref:DNA-directed DNA polymerase n=1 Tax=Cyphomyrmex costatus TaxID=456900 RepID=A0A151IHK5_9HYME|nr:hypothetical protein ALC62_07766 [Cyphomyrmex costatus]